MENPYKKIFPTFIKNGIANIQKRSVNVLNTQTNEQLMGDSLNFIDIYNFFSKDSLSMNYSYTYMIAI